MIAAPIVDLTAALIAGLIADPIATVATGTEIEVIEVIEATEVIGVIEATGLTTGAIVATAGGIGTRRAKDRGGDVRSASDARSRQIGPRT